MAKKMATSPFSCLSFPVDMKLEPMSGKRLYTQTPNKDIADEQNHHHCVYLVEEERMPMPGEEKDSNKNNTNAAAAINYVYTPLVPKNRGGPYYGPAIVIDDTHSLASQRFELNRMLGVHGGVVMDGKQRAPLLVNMPGRSGCTFSKHTEVTIYRPVAQSSLPSTKTELREEVFLWEQGEGGSGPQLFRLMDFSQRNGSNLQYFADDAFLLTNAQVKELLGKTRVTQKDDCKLAEFLRVHQSRVGEFNVYVELGTDGFPRAVYQLKKNNYVALPKKAQLFHCKFSVFQRERIHPPITEQQQQITAREFILQIYLASLKREFEEAQEDRQKAPASGYPRYNNNNNSNRTISSDNPSAISTYFKTPPPAEDRIESFLVEAVCARRLNKLAGAKRCIEEEEEEIHAEDDEEFTVNTALYGSVSIRLKKKKRHCHEKKATTTTTTTNSER